MKLPQPYDVAKKLTQTIRVGSGFNCTTDIYEFYGKSLKRDGDGQLCNPDKRVRYIVNIEHYANNTYAVKFYCAEHKENARKYELLTNYYDAFKVLSTLICLILNVLRDNPKASFVFKAEAIPGEDIHNTKRFRVYTQLIANYVGQETFEQQDIIEKSIYLLANKSVANENSELVLQIEKMFLEVYPELAL